MKTVHIGVAKSTLSTLPKPSSYMSTAAKRHFKAMAKRLISLDRLKETFLPLLEVYAEAMAQYEWAIKEIKFKNAEEYGSGYIQKYKTGATNVSTEVSLKNNAETTILKCCKQFGLDPKSEKELNAEDNSGQMSLMAEFEKALTANK